MIHKAKVAVCSQIRKKHVQNMLSIEEVKQNLKNCDIKLDSYSSTGS